MRIFLTLSLLALLPAAPALSHEGEDHGETKKTLVKKPAPAPVEATAPTSTATVEGKSSGTRAEANLEGNELLLVYQRPHLTAYLSDATTNVPAKGALITINVPGVSPQDGWRLAPEARGGIYLADVGEIRSGTHQLIVTITQEGKTARAELALTIAEAQTSTESNSWWIWFLGILALAAVIAVIARKQILRRRVVVSVLALLLLPRIVFAHGGEQHGEEKEQASMSQQSTGGLAGSYELAKESQFVLGIRTEPAVPRPLAGQMRVPGVLRVPPNGEAILTPPYPGKLRAPRNGFPQLGDRVEKGQVLGLIESTLSPTDEATLIEGFSQATAEFSRAQQELALAERNAERAVQLEGVLSLKEQEEAQARLVTARSQYQAAKRVVDAVGANSAKLRSQALRSPISGVVAQTNAVQGALVSPDKTLFHVVDNHALWLEANLFESQLAFLTSIADARLAVDAFPEEVFRAKLVATGQVVDPQTKTLRVVFRVSNYDYRLKPGMTANAILRRAEEKPSLSISSAALFEQAGKQWVFVKNSAEEFELREVEAGVPDDGYVPVTRGLSPGELVVTTGVFQLRSSIGQ